MEKLLTTKKVTVRLYADDIDILKRAYPVTGYNKVVRDMVHGMCEKLEKKLEKVESE